mmetsp:Transcript_31886/g.79536  ORF Transcript_31886/g.79536 Transcript_31886/m.79536 type:complete len:838 (+) Transcript_31886:219-2732(+)
MADSAERRPFALSAELRGHEQDVRCVAASSCGEVLTASRDATLRVWARAVDAPGYSCVRSLVGHSHYVGAVAVVPGSGVAISGSNDKHVIVWDEASDAPLRVLEGHTDVVSCVAVSEEGDIISGSWDKTVRIWRAGGMRSCEVLTGHTQAVWAVLPFPGGVSVASASGDRTVRIWRGGKSIATLEGHTDVVRGLALVAGLGFASVANDGTLRLWSLDGSALLTIAASESFLYSVASLPSGELAVCGEDRTLRLFRDGNLVQAIPHPSPVWSVACLPNGDLVTGCADSVARVFSCDAALKADSSVLSTFLMEVQAQTLPATEIPGQVGGVDVANLPDESALSEPGTKEGQYKIVRDATGDPCLYTWSMADGQWNKVGTVVGDPNSASAPSGVGPTLGQKHFKGELYDFVFDVDIAEGQPPLQLPYNRATDPFTAAQQFIWDNDLPQTYLEQTADFIVQNAGPSTGVNTFRNVDPFTAGGSYVPPPAGTGNGGGGGGGAALNVDPITAVGAYRPTYAPEGARAPIEDPLSANRYRPGAPTTAPPPGNGANSNAANFFPARAAVTFEAMANPETVLAKLAGFNGRLASAGNGDVLSDAELGALTVMGGALAQAVGGPARLPASELPALALGALAKACRWPTECVFPALDILRLALLNQAGAASVGKMQPPLVPLLLSLLAPNAAAPVPTAVMALRSLCNMCAVTQLHGLIGEHMGAVLEAAAEHLGSDKNVQARTAAVTLLLNFSVFVSKSSTSEEEAQAQILSALAPELAQMAEGTVNEDICLRLLVTLGTLACSATGANYVKRLATDLGVCGSVSALGKAGEKVQACAAQLGALLASK